MSAVAGQPWPASCCPPRCSQSPPQQEGEEMGGEKLVDGDKNETSSWPPRPEDEGG